MWDDLPKRTSSSVKILIIVLLLIVLGVFGYVGYIFYKDGSDSKSNTPTSSLLDSDKNSGNPTSSPSLDPSPSVSPTISPTAAVDLKIPEGETLIESSKADTNGDQKDEFLVITAMKNNKFHAYVLSNDGQALFDDKEMPQKPVRIATQTYDPSVDTYLSWMLVFTEQSGNLAFIHWNGTKYEIPQNESGI